MNLFMNIIFMVTCYPILFVMYFLLRNAGDRGAYCFGATLNAKLRKDEAVTVIDAEYRRNLKRGTIICSILPIAFFFIPYFSISMSLWMMWILAICFVPMLWFAIANHKILDLKQERGWQEENVITYGDLKAATVPRRVKLLTFLPTLVFSTIPVILAFTIFRGYGYGVFGWMVALFGACTYLFFVCAVWTDKQKIMVICEDSDTNLNFARAKKQVWKNFWLVCAWSNTVFTWFMLLFMWQREWAMSGVIWGSVVYCLVAIAASLWLVKKLLDINRTYMKKRTLSDAADDDSNWLWGMLYYNKKDKHFLTESRMGTGTSVNLGHKAGMITMVASGALLLLIPVMCIWMILVEFTPLKVSVENDTIVCKQLSVEYEIPLEDISAYETITELPELTKMSGTGMDNFLSGTFEVFHQGVYEVFLNPQNSLFIKLTVGEKEYYIGGVDDEETQAVLESIRQYKEVK